MKNLYVVVNRVSKFPVSAIIPAQNDVEAIRGFMASFDTQDKEHPRFFSPIEEHKLVKVGEINDYFEITKTCYDTVCTGEDCETRLADLVKVFMED